VAFLLDAPLQMGWEQWSEPRPGRVTVLAGLDEDWMAAEVSPDIRLPLPNPEIALRLTSSRVDALRVEYQHAGAEIRGALAAVALGNDVPAAELRIITVPALFRRVKPVPGGAAPGATCWVATEGAWLAWHALRPLIQPADAETAALLGELRRPRLRQLAHPLPFRNST
jgi:hypothetical protein